jgi:ribosomal protein S18 acetylase RimI-like enzyme
MISNAVISQLAVNDIDQITSSFKDIGWNKPESLYKNYLWEQAENKRNIFVVKQNQIFCGYVTIKWKPEYAYFREQRIPEISDLNVLPNYRNRGIGSELIAVCEAIAKERNYKYIGLGVGMTADYGSAQRLYVKLGYVPDGHGLHYKNMPAPHGKRVMIDDDLVIYLMKTI